MRWKSARPLLTAGLVLALVACSGGGAGPTEFNQADGPSPGLHHPAKQAVDDAAHQALEDDGSLGDANHRGRPDPNGARR